MHDSQCFCNPYVPINKISLNYSNEMNHSLVRTKRNQLCREVYFEQWAGPGKYGQLMENKMKIVFNGVIIHRERLRLLFCCKIKNPLLLLPKIA